jgi:hypothetical protein
MKDAPARAIQELDGPSAVANAIRVVDENSAIGDSLATAQAALVTA